MLLWCSECQQFICEVPEYDNLMITHGMCDGCNETSATLSERELGRAIFLRQIFWDLFDAGKRSDLAGAREIIDGAIAANCKPIDILIGMLAPMLYQIGRDWEGQVIGIEDEHQFTAFCQEVIDVVTASTREADSTLSPGIRGNSVLLMNAPGNQHILGIQIAALWLHSRGIKTQVAPFGIDFTDLLDYLARVRPTDLLISMALVEQRDGVAALVEHLLCWPRALRPRIIVGGYAVKTGQVATLPGVELTSDLRLLRFSHSDRP